MSNYDDYMLLHIDGELTEAEDKAFIAFLDRHPELREELLDYEAVKLAPDMTQVYGMKEALLKPEPKGRIIRLGQWYAHGAAAGVILLILFFASQWLNTGTHTQQPLPPVAKHEIPAQVNPATTVAQTKEENVPTPALAVETKAQSVAERGVHSNTSVAIAKHNSIEKIEIGRIKPLDGPTAINVIAQKRVELSETAYAEVTQEDVHETKKTDLLALLPVSEEKKEGLTSLKNNVEAKFNQVKKIKENLKDTEVGVRLGGRELFVINF